MTTDPEGNDIFWLAESYTGETHDDNPNVPEGYTRFVFDMIQNTTWTDGTSLTAEDVAFTLNYFRDAPGNPYGPDLVQMTAAYAPSTYRVVEFNTESYWHLHSIVYKPILPKHIFQEIGVDGWNLWQPNPPTDAMVTSGPFNVSEYVAGEFTELTYNPNFFYGPDRTEGPSGPTTTEEGVDLTLAIVAGAVGAAVVILVGGYVLLRQK